MIHSTTQVEATRERLRAAMPAARNWTYLDHAALSPLPRPTADALQSWLTEAVETGNPRWPDWVKRVETMRANAARMVNAHPDEIALIGNTTAGISLVAEGIEWRPGDNVVTLADEFPSNVYPWLNLQSRGVETRRVPTEESGRPDINKLAAAIDERTRVVTVSWIGFATGYRHDVKRIAEVAHEKGALMFLDAIQGLGVFPLDVEATGIDFMAADGHKWLLGPEGAGIAYLRRERLEELRPIGPGWHSVRPGQDYTHIELNLRPTAARYEGGTQNSAGMIAFGASLELLTDLGIESIAEGVLAITDHACNRLRAIGAKIVSDRDMDHRGGEQRSGIVAFEILGKDAMALKRHAMRQNVVFGVRAGRLRISPHAYNNEEDVERLIEALTSFK